MKKKLVLIWVKPEDRKILKKEALDNDMNLKDYVSSITRKNNKNIIEENNDKRKHGKLYWKI